MSLLQFRRRRATTLRDDAVAVVAGTATGPAYDLAHDASDDAFPDDGAFARAIEEGRRRERDPHLFDEAASRDLALALADSA